MSRSKRIAKRLLEALWPNRSFDKEDEEILEVVRILCDEESKYNSEEMFCYFATALSIGNKVIVLALLDMLLFEEPGISDRERDETRQAFLQQFIAALRKTELHRSEKPTIENVLRARQSEYVGAMMGQDDGVEAAHETIAEELGFERSLYSSLKKQREQRQKESEVEIDTSLVAMLDLCTTYVIEDVAGLSDRSFLASDLLTITIIRKTLSEWVRNQMDIMRSVLRAS